MAQIAQDCMSATSRLGAKWDYSHNYGGSWVNGSCRIYQSANTICLFNGDALLGTFATASQAMEKASDIRIDRLIKLAVGRMTLANGLRTARACGDAEWIAANDGRMDDYDKEIDALRSQMTKCELLEAMNYTNAPL